MNALLAREVSQTLPSRYVVILTAQRRRFAGMIQDPSYKRCVAPTPGNTSVGANLTTRNNRTDWKFISKRSPYLCVFFLFGMSQFF